MPSERKRRRSTLNEIFRGSLFNEVEEIFREFSEEGFVGGYSISVVQTPKGTKVKARVGEGVDVNALKRRLQQ
ncbi:MAG: hypothetical protein QXS10_03605 [Candidatus Bathyarchaeia archaeon]